jgi:hypothetical protein
MTDRADVTFWLQKLQSDDSLAPAIIWENVFDKLARIVRRRLERGNLERRTRDEEDLALSAIKSLLVGVTDGRFRLDNRNDLWRSLLWLAKCKIHKKREYDHAEKRGGGSELSGQAIKTYDQRAFGDPEEGAGIGEIMGTSPSPEFAVLMLEAFEQLSDEEQAVAVLKMHGASHESIAKEMNCSTQTVTRRVNAIKRKWSPQHPRNR